MLLRKSIEKQVGIYRKYTTEYENHILESHKRMSRLNTILFFAHGMFVGIMEYWLWKEISPEFKITMIVAGISLIDYMLCLFYLPRHKEKAIIATDIYVTLMIIGLVSTDIFLQPSQQAISFILITVTMMLSAMICIVPVHFWVIILIAVLGGIGDEIFVLFETNVTEIYDKVTWLYYSLDYVLMVLFALAVNLMFANLKYKEIKQEHDLKSRVQTDLLTGLYNRQYMQQAIEEDADVRKGGMMLCIDLDNFKKVNDTFGHGKGDEVLIRVSNILKTCFRKTDYVARLGGDEFLVFMHPVADNEVIISSIQKLLKKFPLIVSEGKSEVKVMLSVGGALLEEGVESAYEFLYKKSDEVMYEAKNGGKGRAVIAENKFMPKAVIDREKVRYL